MTFVDHSTADLIAIMDEFAEAPNKTIGQLLDAPEPDHGTENKELFAAVTKAGQQFVATFSANGGVVRRFCARTKHGFPITRSFEVKGPPFFGANADVGIWAIVRRPVAESGDLAAVGFRASAELVERLAKGTGILSEASVHLASLIRGGIEGRHL